MWPGVTTPSVYPALAAVPMIIALVAGAKYALGWMLLVEALNAMAFILVLRWSRDRSKVAAWWWLVFMGLTGALTLTRLDSVAVPISVAGLLFALTRPALAATLLTVAAWLKVWPAMIVLALFATGDRWRVARVAVGISISIIIVAVVIGGGLDVFTFAAAQGTRGLEVGAPVATIWLWLAALGLDGSHPIYNDMIKAFEVTGNGSTIAGTIVSVLSVVALAAIFTLGLRAQRHNAENAALIPVMTLALLASVVVFNKVGSPQYVMMLAVPVVVGLLWSPRLFRVPAALAAIAAGLTQVIFPWFFLALVRLEFWMLITATIRNAFQIALLAWAIATLWKMAPKPSRPLGQESSGKNSPFLLNAPLGDV